LIAEYHSDPVPPPAGGGGTSYLTTDHLGSTRVVTGTNPTQPVKARYDYLPFGEELGATIGQRTTAMGYGAADSTKQKFTQKERDSESGLDYFGARYYSPVQGRFTSVDPSRKSIKQGNPQTWNRYSYAYNSPFRFVDDNGKWPTETHNKIIEQALPGLARTGRLHYVQHGSRTVDGGDSGLVPHTLLPSNAHQHAMVDAQKIKELGSYAAARDWAKNEMNRFIQEKVTESKTALDNANLNDNTGGIPGREHYEIKALEAFGEAIHPIMDNVSPAHRDFQVYDTSGWSLSVNGVITAGLDIYSHAKAEERDPTPEEMNQMVQEIRKLYGEVFGEKALKDATTVPK
jgi:RHS repeat-associated protein